MDPQTIIEGGILVVTTIIAVQVTRIANKVTDGSNPIHKPPSATDPTNPTDPNS